MANWGRIDWAGQRETTVRRRALVLLLKGAVAAVSAAAMLALAALAWTLLGAAQVAGAAIQSSPACDVTLNGGVYGGGLATAGNVCVAPGSGPSYLQAGSYTWQTVTVLSGGDLVLSLQADCGSFTPPSTLTVTGGGKVEASGSLHLSDSLNCYYGGESDLIVSGGVLTNFGTISADACDDPTRGCLFGSNGSAGPRGLSGHIVNKGSIRSDARTPILDAGGSLVNAGTLSIGTSDTNTVGHGFQVQAGAGATFTNGSGGSINAVGDFLMQGGNTFLQGAGTSTGLPLVLDGDTLRYTGVGSGTIQVEGSGSVSGNVAAGQILQLVTVCNGPGDATASFPADTTNAGEIDTATIACGTGTSHVVVAAGKTLTNSGLISVGGNAPLTLQGDLTNLGTVHVHPGQWDGGNQSLAYQGGRFTNGGTVTVDDGSLFDVVGGAGATFTNTMGGSVNTNGNAQLQLEGSNGFVEAGTTTGNAVLVNGANLHYTGTGSGHVDVWGSVALSGDLARGQILELQNSGGFCQHPTPVVTAAAGFTNAGTIFTTGCNGAPSLTVSSGTLTNSGTIESGAGLTLQATVKNRGLIQADYNTTININALTNYSATTNTLTGGRYAAGSQATIAVPGMDIHTNAADVELSSSRLTDGSNDALRDLSVNEGTLDLSNQTETLSGGLTNSGHLGLDYQYAAGDLVVNGAYTQTSAATLTVAIDGTWAGNNYGQLRVNGPASLAGTLDLVTTPTYTPASGDTQQVMTYSSLTGVFGKVKGTSAGKGVSYVLRYGPSAAEVVVTPTSLAIRPHSGAPGAAVQLTGSGYSPGESVAITYVDRVNHHVTTLAPATAGSNGAFVVAETVPAGASVGAGRLTATGITSGVAASARFTVT